MIFRKFQYITDAGVFFTEKDARINNNCTRRELYKKISLGEWSKSLNTVVTEKRTCLACQDEFDITISCKQKNKQVFCCKKCKNLYTYYKISKKYYDELLKIQNNSCAICNTTFTGKQINVDHDHLTGKVRGLLCSNCNRGIGLIGEKYLKYRKAEAYLSKHDENNFLKFSKIRDVKSPIRSTPFSAGIDFFVPNDFSSVAIKPNHDVLIPSGIKVLIPDNHVLIAYNKSGISTKKKLIVGACVIDQDYRGEIHIHLINIGKEDVQINPGDKVVQFILQETFYVNIVEENNELIFKNKETIRNTGGFGSTNQK